jgi:ribonuclease P protein component
VGAASAGGALAGGTPADLVEPARVGFVVGRVVGGSVDRHRVVRRLRHLVRDRLGRLPAGALVVIRALPAARGAESGTLGRDLDAALGQLLASGPAAAGAAGRVDHAAGRGRPVMRS